MRVAIDATTVVSRRKGAGIMVEGLIRESPPNSLIGSALLFVDASFEAEARLLWPGREIYGVQVKSSLMWETVTLPRLVSTKKIDALITTRDRTLAGGGAKTITWLFEVPDHRVKLMIKSPAPLFRKMVGTASMARFRHIAPRVSNFVVTSEFTRRDLLDRYDISDSQISVVYPGIDPVYLRRAETTAAPADRHLPGSKPYVLHFATGDLRDNSRVAMASFAKAANAVTFDADLVVAGVPSHLGENIRAMANSLGIGDRVQIKGYVPANEMPALYRQASVYFDPTLFEGFGIQLLEAMACGTPVISSNVSSVPELVEDAGILLDPDDDQGFSIALTELLGSPELRRELADKGIRRAAQFGWEGLIVDFDRILSSY